MNYVAYGLQVDMFVTQQTGLSRESLYRSFSGEGNPAFSTVVKVMDAFGLQLEVKAKQDANV